MCEHVQVKTHTHLGMKCHFQLSNKLGTLKCLEGFCKHPQGFKETKQPCYTKNSKCKNLQMCIIVTYADNNQHAADKIHFKLHKSICYSYKPLNHITDFNNNPKREGK